MRAIIFIDYWNFQLNWNDRTGRAKCDWAKLGPSILSQVQGMLGPMGLGPVQLEGVRLYASSQHGDPAAAKMVTWMKQTLQRIPGWSVFLRERHSHPKPVHCKECGHDIEFCPKCSKVLKRSAEKGVDSAIVADMIALAWEGAYDLAVLVSQDADFTPGVKALAQKGNKVVNAGWTTGGHNLQQECWASFSLEDLVTPMTRT